jgi:RHS repeat-associated protein
MRVKKHNTWVSHDETTGYRYDGQMRVEDVSPLSTPGERGRGEGSKSGSPFQTDELVTRYGIGARGIEVISKDDGGGEVFGFPIYDTHGNMLATLGRDGSSYTTGNWQTYDVWGSVRSGSSSEEQGYVANLGHRSDPESYLTYMRARYYEPHTGRFVSQDPAYDGFNCFVYAGNDPTNCLDYSGRSKAAEKFEEIYDSLRRWMNNLGYDFHWSIQAVAIIVKASIAIAENIAYAYVAFRLAKWMLSCVGPLATSPMPWASAGALVAGAALMGFSLWMIVDSIMIVRNAFMELLALGDFL